jgi:carbamoyltransferase
MINQNGLENGKTMGLSSYGSAKHFDKFFLKDSFTVDESLFTPYPDHFFTIFSDYKEKFKSSDNHKKIKITEDNYKFYADYAYQIQHQTQEAVCRLIKKSIEKTGIKNICISGGYGMNVVANYFYLKQFPDLNFYFDPLSDDTGIALGASQYIYREKTKDTKKYPLQTLFFHGEKYDISSYQGKNCSLDDISELIIDNKSVAVYTGLSEVGQRSLGNRSILFNALNPDAKKIVNEIKKREYYRPFAAVVMEEDAENYFDMGNVKSSPYMTICFPAKITAKSLIPGVIHVDNTCRIQTVNKNDGYLYDLLFLLKKKTNHGIILNTSFNLAGLPLVETPDDAFYTLNNSFLNYLWFQETQQLFS